MKKKKQQKQKLNRRGKTPGHQLKANMEDQTLTTAMGSPNDTKTLTRNQKGQELRQNVLSLENGLPELSLKYPGPSPSKDSSVPASISRVLHGIKTHLGALVLFKMSESKSRKERDYLTGRLRMNRHQWNALWVKVRKVKGWDGVFKTYLPNFEVPAVGVEEGRPLPSTDCFEMVEARRIAVGLLVTAELGISTNFDPLHDLLSRQITTFPPNASTRQYWRGMWREEQNYGVEFLSLIKQAPTVKAVRAYAGDHNASGSWKSLNRYNNWLNDYQKRPELIETAEEPKPWLERLVARARKIIEMSKVEKVKKRPHEFVQANEGDFQYIEHPHFSKDMLAGVMNEIMTATTKGWTNEQMGNEETRILLNFKSAYLQLADFRARQRELQEAAGKEGSSIEDMTGAEVIEVNLAGTDIIPLPDAVELKGQQTLWGFEGDAGGGNQLGIGYANKERSFTGGVV